MKLFQRLFGKIEIGEIGPTKVEVLNFPIRQNPRHFTCLNFTFNPQSILLVTPVVNDTPVVKEGEQAAVPVFRFSVYVDRQVRVDFPEPEEEKARAKREMFLRAWSEALNL